MDVIPFIKTMDRTSLSNITQKEFERQTLCCILSLYSHRHLTETLKTLSKVFRAVEPIHQTYSLVLTRPHLRPRPLSLSCPPTQGKSLPSHSGFQFLCKPRRQRSQTAHAWNRGLVCVLVLDVCHPVAAAPPSPAALQTPSAQSAFFRSYYRPIHTRLAGRHPDATPRATWAGASKHYWR
jgi:hypothetical protein